MIKFCDVLILGSGPAGLLSGLIASEKRQVTIVEKPDRHFLLGKRILVSGNGRANFFNSDLLNFPNGKETLSYLENKCDFAYTTEGKLYYPFFNKSECLHNALTSQLSRQKVSILKSTATKVNSQRKTVELLDENNKPYLLSYNDLVIATGGRSYDRNDFTYQLIDSLGLVYYPFHSCLCPVITKEKIFSSLIKNKLKAKVTLMKDSDILYEENGEVLFKENGLSGIAIFNCSLFINQELRKDPNAKFRFILDPLYNLSSSFSRKKLDSCLPSFFREYLKKSNKSIEEKLV
ncbi:MAG: NAD(P)/FAD-dependent oxidoreductase, partial [Bacilli bacterium]